MSATWWTLPRRRMVSGTCDGATSLAWAQRTLSAMATTEGPASAIVVRVPVPPRPRASYARRWDRAAGVGVPGPRDGPLPVPAGRPTSTPDVRRPLAAIAAAHEPFDVRFARVGRFPSVVYLAPEPAAPFTA